MRETSSGLAERLMTERGGLGFFSSASGDFDGSASGLALRDSRGSTPPLRSASVRPSSSSSSGLPDDSGMWRLGSALGVPSESPRPLMPTAPSATRLITPPTRSATPSSAPTPARRDRYHGESSFSATHPRVGQGTTSAPPASRGAPAAGPSRPDLDPE